MQADEQELQLLAKTARCGTMVEAIKSNLNDSQLGIQGGGVK